jgi:hypothetical protein
VKTNKRKRPVIEAGYHGFRTATGETPRQLVDMQRAHLLNLELKQKRGELVTLESVQTRDREQNEIVLNSLAQLSHQIAYQFPLKKEQQDKLCKFIQDKINNMLADWINSNIVEPRHP